MASIWTTPIKKTVSCPQCSKEFETDRPNVRYCTPECKKEYRRGKYIGSFPKVCLTCKTPFIARTEDYKYCKSSCFQITRKKIRKAGVCKVCDKEYKGHPRCINCFKLIHDPLTTKCAECAQ